MCVHFLTYTNMNEDSNMQYVCMYVHNMYICIYVHRMYVHTYIVLYSTIPTYYVRTVTVNNMSLCMYVQCMYVCSMYVHGWTCLFDRHL